MSPINRMGRVTPTDDRLLQELRDNFDKANRSALARLPPPPAVPYDFESSSELYQDECQSECQNECQNDVKIEQLVLENKRLQAELLLQKDATDSVKKVLENLLEEKQSKETLATDLLSKKIENLELLIKGKPNVREKITHEIERKMSQLVHRKREIGAKKKPPFVVGTSTSKSYSVPVNIQRVMSILKAHNPWACPLCNKTCNRCNLKARDLVHAHLEAPINNLQEEYRSLCQDYSDALKVYDAASLDEKLAMHPLLQNAAQNMAHKAEKLSQITNTDFNSMGILRCSQRVMDAFK